MGLTAFIVIFLMCLIPCHVFYLRARIDLAITLWHILISPFGVVKFKDFFLADILTSFVVPLKDLGNVGCFFFNGLWEKSQMPTNEVCPSLENYQLAIAFLPFWWRLAQCFRRYHETKL